MDQYQTRQFCEMVLNYSLVGGLCYLLWKDGAVIFAIGIGLLGLIVGLLPEK